MRISELPLTTNPTSTDELPIDRNGVTYRVKYEALRGPQGDPGEDGTIENLNAAATTLAPGSQATASYENNLLTLGIPQGAKGDPGDDGQDGVGVPSGGTTGQVLKKKSNTNYDTEWANESGGGGGALWGNITGTLSNQSDLQTALNAKADTSDIPTKVSDLTNDAGYLPALGGTAGQILIKNSSTDLDAAWSNPTVPIALSLNTTNVSTFLGVAVKLFNLVIISGRFNLKSFSSGSWKNLAVMPEGFRPTAEKGFMAGHGGTVAVRDGVVGSNGNLNVYCETSDSYIFCTIIYDI